MEKRRRILFMKKWKVMLCFLVLTLCFVCGFATDTQAAVKLNRSSLTLVEGQSATLKLTGTKKTVTWKSNKKTVATVSKKGKVTAKAPGYATISATAGKTTKKCKVTVSVDYAKTYEYQVKYGKVTINKLLRISETDLTIPETIEGYPVTELADGLFKGCDGLVSISLPAEITKIGDSVFEGCHTLQEVRCAGKLTSIDSRAFYECHALREIQSEGTITSLGSYAFYECNALETLPDLSGISDIGEYAFYNCDRLISIPVLPTLTSIKNYAFFDCDRLLTFFIPDSLVSIGDYAFKGCDELLSINGCKNVQTIGTECFADCKKLGSATLGNKLTTLGTGCFSGCERLSSITLSPMLTAIPDRCFYNCFAIGSNSTTLTIPASVTKIGSMAFFNCIALKYLTIPGTSITSIGTDSFAGVPLNTLEIWYRPSPYINSWLSGLGLGAGHIHSIYYKKMCRSTFPHRAYTSHPDRTRPYLSGTASLPFYSLNFPAILIKNSALVGLPFRLSHG